MRGGASAVAVTLDRARRAFKQFRADEKGATAIEYSLIIGLVFLAILGAVRNFATSTNEMYSEINSTLEDATS